MVTVSKSVRISHPQHTKRFMHLGSTDVNATVLYMMDSFHMSGKKPECWTLTKHSAFELVLVLCQIILDKMENTVVFSVAGIWWGEFEIVGFQFYFRCEVLILMHSIFGLAMSVTTLKKKQFSLYYGIFINLKTALINNSILQG